MTGRHDANANPISGGDLAAFVVTVETSSLQAAADALTMTPSAVTKRIQALERRVGTALFERGRFGMRPTPAGRTLYPEAKHALQALDRAEAVVREASSQARRIVAIAASHTIGEYLLPAWLAEARTREPTMRAQVEVVNSPGVLDAVRDGDAEIGFVEGTDDLAAFTTLDVFDDEMVVVVSRDHPWCRRSAVGAAELSDEPYLTREAGSGTRAVAEAALAAAGLRLVPSFEAGSTQAVKRTLPSGGFSILSRLAVGAELHDGSLREVSVADLHLGRRLRAVHDPARPPEGLAKGLWEWLASRP